MPSLFQRSSLTFGEAKSWVAEQHNKQTNGDMLLRAGRAIQRAVKDWNRYRWEWMITEGATVNVTGGLTHTQYPVPFDYRDMYNLVFTQGGTSRALVQDTKRGYDRVMPQPYTSITSGYNLAKVGQLGKFELQDPPNADGTIRLLYYRRMYVPSESITATVTAYADASEGTRLYMASTAGIQIGSPVSVVKSSVEQLEEGTIIVAVEPGYVVLSSAPTGPDAGSGTLTAGGDSTFLDVHVDFEWDLLARAVEHFLVSVGASEVKLSYWMQAAAKGLEKAQAMQNDHDDRELCFEPLPWWGGYNPNRIVE